MQGIGKEYALALAEYGLNIVLVSRNKQELENTANEIRDKHKVDTLTVVADFPACELNYVKRITQNKTGLSQPIPQASLINIPSNHHLEVSLGFILASA